MAENGWYIAMVKPNPERYFLMAGPYDTREEADAHADECKNIAYDLDGYNWFETWGTGRFNTREPGKLSHMMTKEQ